MFPKTTFVSAALAAISSAQVDLQFTSQGKFDLKNAAFLSMSKFSDSDDFLLVSSFGAMSSGQIYVVPGVKDAVQLGDVKNLKPIMLNTPKFEWPNNIKIVPEDVFGERVIMVPDGFLVPTKTNGGLYAVRMDPKDITKTTGTVKISAKKDGYFYHMGYWVDLNGDGRKDYITARSNAKKGQGELLWLENPVKGLDAGQPWVEHSLGNLADVAFELQTLPEYKDEIVIFSAHFFDEAIRMTRVSTLTGTVVATRTIDDSKILSAYNVSLVDLNGDGNRQLLVNNHEKKNNLTGIYAYKFPKDLMNDAWERNTVASNFQNAFSLTVPNMSPGFAYAVYPNGQHKGERAHILVAGDGDHSAHMLYPSGDASVFNYTDNIFMKAGGTVGSLETSDLDTDGWLEVWMPNYDKSYIELFKMSPAKAAAFLQ